MPDEVLFPPLSNSELTAQVGSAGDAAAGTVGKPTSPNPDVGNPSPRIAGCGSLFIVRLCDVRDVVDRRESGLDDPPMIEMLLHTFDQQHVELTMTAQCAVELSQQLAAALVAASKPPKEDHHGARRI